MEPDYSKPLPNPPGWPDHGLIGRPQVEDYSKPLPNPPGWHEQPREPLKDPFTDLAPVDYHALNQAIARKLSGRSTEHLRNGAAGARGEKVADAPQVPPLYGGFGKPNPNRGRRQRG